MKVIITENKLRKLQINHLDNTLRGGVAEFDNFIIIYYYDTSDDYENSEVLMEYDFEDGRLYVDNKFLKDFGLTYFPNEDDAQSVIKDWFENYFGVKIKYIES
jgi:hypothetical protein